MSLYKQKFSKLSGLEVGKLIKDKKNNNNKKSHFRSFKLDILLNITS